MKLRDSAEVIISRSPLPPDLDGDASIPQASQGLGVGRVVAGVDRKWRSSIQPPRQVIPDQGKRFRLPPMSRRHEFPDLLPASNRKTLLGSHLLGQFGQGLEPGRDDPSIMER